MATRSAIPIRCAISNRFFVAVCAREALRSFSTSENSLRVRHCSVFSQRPKTLTISKTVAYGLYTREKKPAGS